MLIYGYEMNYWAKHYKNVNKLYFYYFNNNIPKKTMYIALDQIVLWLLVRCKCITYFMNIYIYFLNFNDYELTILSDLFALWKIMDVFIHI